MHTLRLTAHSPPLNTDIPKNRFYLITDCLFLQVFFFQLSYSTYIYYLYNVYINYTHCIYINNINLKSFNPFLLTKEKRGCIILSTKLLLTINLLKMETVWTESGWKTQGVMASVGGLVASCLFAAEEERNEHRELQDAQMFREIEMESEFNSILINELIR